MALVLTLLHLALGLLYSVITPPWEAHDEWAHYKYAEYLALQRALPPSDQPLTTLFGYDQATQPPLYYFLAALPIALVQPADSLEPALNPYATSGVGEAGVNMTVHDPRTEGFPYRGTILALHLARGMSVLFSTLAVWVTYLLMRRLAVDRPAILLLALAVVALSPQSLFIGSMVTNDALMILWGAVLLLFACRVALEPPAPAAFIGLGASLGLALLTKYTAVGFIPVIVLAVILSLVRQRRQDGAPGRRLLLLGSALALLVLLGLSGWWFARNVREYDSLISRDSATLAHFVQGLQAPGQLLAAVPWELVPAALWYGFQTFWASFGWGNVGLPEKAYIALAVLCGLALLGCLDGLVSRRLRGRPRSALFFLGLSALIFSLPPLYRDLLQNSPTLRGRFLLPILPAAGYVLALGLLSGLPRRWRNRLAGLLGVALLAAALALPFLLIQPAYARPAPPASVELPEGAVPFYARFGRRAELYGYQIWPDTARQGRAVAVTLYWRALRENTENFTVGVYVLGAENQPYGQVMRYPGRGNAATSLWQAGDLLTDVYWVPVQTDLPVPCQGQVMVSLFQDGRKIRYLPVLDQNGQALGDGARFGRFKIAPATPTTAELEPALARFSDQMAMVGWQVEGGQSAGETLTLHMRLQALRRPEADYTLFVQLLNGDGEWVAGSDEQPLGGNYPFSLWEAGETMEEQRDLRLPLNLPTGAYHLGIGLYHPESGTRLPAQGPDGGALPDAIWLSEQITIEAGPPCIYFPLAGITPKE